MPARKRPRADPFLAKQPGVAVDSFGGGVVDPTANVIALSAASNLRQDDLREETNKRIDTELACVKELSQLRSAHLAQLAELRAEHAKEIRDSETNRLNAIRQVDVLAVNTAADRALAAIQTLAATTTANADTLRAMVASTASTIATQTTATVQAITERLAALEKSSYEGKGKQAVADPMLTEMVAELKALRVSQNLTAGKAEGLSAGWGLLLGAVGLISTLLAIYAALKP